MKTGLDVLLSNNILKNKLRGKRISLVAHPASTTRNLKHSLDALMESGLNVTSTFGPQHGMRGEKQDNMIESDDYLDPQFKIPVFSLYGQTRRPTDASMDTFDICLFDLQDIGTRIYTFLTTLKYMMEACTQHKKTLWILDRPNPAGRPIEGTFLRSGWESFVGAGPFPMRHGLTLAECALWLKSYLALDLDLEIILMEDYNIDIPPMYGWPSHLSWVNPSPNCSTPHMPKIFPGSVLIEGTHLSEGRGTTRALEIMGAPDIDINKVLLKMEALEPNWLKGCLIRPCFFEPTFHKHAKTLCQGFQIHIDHPNYHHETFKPYRLVSLFLKSIRNLYPDYKIWRNFPYEYETEKLAIDLINGSPLLREWVDDQSATPNDFETINLKDESEWAEKRKEFLLY